MLCDTAVSASSFLPRALARPRRNCLVYITESQYGGGAVESVHRSPVSQKNRGQVSSLCLLDLTAAFDTLTNLRNLWQCSSMV